MLKEYECLQCVDAIRDGFKTVDEMITKGEYATLAHDFKTCTDLTDKDDDCDSSQTAVTAYLNQAFYTIRAGGRTGEFPVGETNRSQTATDVVMVIT